MIPANDWEIKKCLRLLLVILLATLGLVGLASVGLDIPGLRQIVGFVFLTFVPGILILRILKIHNTGIVESLLYSVGLSLAFVMFTGTVANFVLPLFGVSKPVSIFPIIAILAVFTLILGAIAYKRDKDFSTPTPKLNIAAFFSPSYLLLLVLPLLAIWGAVLVNFYQNNFLLLFFIIIVACVVALVAFDRLPQKAYPLAIVMIAMGLLLHTTLISEYLMRWNVDFEYYYQSLVIQNGLWNPSLPHDVNSVLSVVMLAPLYSLILNMDSVWLFKLIYPLIFCLVPLVLFQTYGKQISAKIAFLSVFFFMSMFYFYEEGTLLHRQQIALLFFALLILLMVDRKLALRQRLSLFIIFSLSLVVSHYAIGYIWLAFLVGAWIVVALIRSKARVIWEWLTSKFGGLPQSLISSRAFPSKIMLGVIGIFLVFSLGWYGIVASGSPLVTIKNIAEYIPREIIHPTTPSPPTITSSPSTTSSLPTTPSPLTKPEVREPLANKDPLVTSALGLDFVSAPVPGKIFWIFQYITQFFIVAGFVRLIFKPRGLRFTAEYIGLCSATALMLLAWIAVPYFSIHIGMLRFYFITLFVLSPLCIIGGEVIWKGASNFYKRCLAWLMKYRRIFVIGSSTPLVGSPAYYRFVALAVLIPYFLFSSGFIFEVTGSYQLIDTRSIPSSSSLSYGKIDTGHYTEKEVAAAQWLGQTAPKDAKVYADVGMGIDLVTLWFYKHKQTSGFPYWGEYMSAEAYIYLRSWNIEHGELVVEPSRRISLEEPTGLSEALQARNIVYNNGGAQVLAPLLPSSPLLTSR